jgi:hypothetical protein
LAISFQSSSSRIAASAFPCAHNIDAQMLSIRHFSRRYN